VNLLEGGINEYLKYVRQDSPASSPSSSSSRPAAAATVAAGAQHAAVNQTRVPSLFKGKNVVFDRRLDRDPQTLRATDDVLAHCSTCGYDVLCRLLYYSVEYAERVIYAQNPQ